MVTFAEFLQFDIRVGEIIKAEPFPQARKPAYRLWIDFGPKIGVKKSSAQITEFYETAALVGLQIVAVINFPPLQVADFVSEALVLGVYTKHGVALLRPDHPAKLGDKIG